MLLSVVAMEPLTSDVKKLRLESADGTSLPSFTPGAHITLCVPMENIALERKYSLVSNPADQHFYEIAVKRNVNSRGGSAYLHEEVRVGSELQVQPPVNEFALAEDASHYVFVAGGIGITPLIGMAEFADRTGQSYELHYVAQCEEGMAFYTSASALSRASLYFSQGKDASRPDLAAILRAHANDPRTHIYVCGPARLIDAVRWSAEALGYPAWRIHFESFGPVWNVDDGVVHLKLSESDMSLSVKPGVTLLDAIEQVGGWIPSECKRGECGACITSYSSGVPLHRDNCLSEAQRAHSFCPCVSWAEADSVLTLQI